MGELTALQLHDKFRHAAGIPPKAVRQDAHAVEFHRRDFGLQCNQPVTQNGVVHCATLADAFFLHQPDQRLEPVFQCIGVAQHATFMAQCGIGHVPPLPALPDDLIQGNPHVGKERFIELGMTGHGLEWSDLDPWCVHREDQVGDAAVLGRVRFGPNKAKDHVRLLGRAGPDLLSVDDKVAIFDAGAGLERGEVRSRSRFRISLTPDYLAI